MQGQTCRWFGFQPVSGQITRITLKFDWLTSGHVTTNIQVPFFGDNANAEASFQILYSTSNGSQWAFAVDRGESSNIVGPGGEHRPFGDSGSFSVDLPTNTPINQIIVRDKLFADAWTSGGGSSSAYVDAIISNIRLEVVTVNCFANVPGDRWRGEYFSNTTNLSGSPAMVRDDGTVLNFNWGDGSPGSVRGLGADNFSARWTRTVNFGSGTHRFTVTVDDGARLYIDGLKIIDAWSIQAPTTYTADMSLSAGNHEVKLEYFESGGGASVSLSWAPICQMAVAANRWKGEYFNNQTPSGSPAMVRDDGDGFLNMNFDVVGGSPGSACGVPADNFSARWTRTVNLAQGIYRFTTTVDNGVRLYVDGYRRIDQWGNLPPNTYTADVFLSAGDHEIKLEFVEYTGGAGVSLSWTTVSGVNCAASVSTDRWKGEYFSNTNLAGATAKVSDDGDGFLNFNFGGGGPGSGCGLGVDYFSARWARTVNFATSGLYRFTVTGDDGVRLYVDGQLKIDAWVSQAATTYTADVTLNKGPHLVKLEYFENDGSAVALLSWTLVTGLSCLPDVPLIGAAPRTGGGESIATTKLSGGGQPCGQKKSE
jgi:hypothetical protein